MKQLTTTFLLYTLLSWALPDRTGAIFSFNRTECQKKVAYFVEGGNKSTLTCTGLANTSNIYWSLIGPSTNGTEIRLGECYDASNGINPWNCTVFDKSYDITRPASNFTTLRFVSNVQNINGGLIKCSQFNNQSRAQAYCSVQERENNGPEFHIPECSSGFLEVSENQSVSLTCTGLWPVSNIYWSISGPSTNDAEVRLGNCSLCYPDCAGTPCVVPDMRYNITRPRFDVTTLEFLSSIQGNGVKCSELNNDRAAQANCIIRITQGNTTPTDTTSTIEVNTTVNTSATRGTATTNNTIEASGTSAFPLALVAGGAGAATLVIVFIIVVVVVVVVRRSKRKRRLTGGEENSNTSGTGHSLAIQESTIPTEDYAILEASSQSAESESSYDGLQISEVGLRSVYSDINHSNTSTQPQTAASESAYAGLRTSDIGLRSVYNDIDHSNTRSQPQTEAASSNYKTLEMSDDGLRLVYSEAGHSNTDTQSRTAPEGAYAILEMSNNTLTSANTEVDDNENNPANDGGDYEIPS